MIDPSERRGMAWLKDICTDDAGNFTPDKVALVGAIWAWLWGVVWFIVYAGVDLIVKNHAFDPRAYGEGLGYALAGGAALLGAGGGAMWLASRQKSSGG